jgi:hypothetical protein
VPYRAVPGQLALFNLPMRAEQKYMLLYIVAMLLAMHICVIYKFLRFGTLDLHRARSGQAKGRKAKPSHQRGKLFEAYATWLK